MIRGLDRPQRELAELIASVSERAWSAGWLAGVEFELWAAMRSEPGGAWPLSLMPGERERLMRASEECGGWIVFDAEREETFIPVAEWVARYASWSDSAEVQVTRSPAERL